MENFLEHHEDAVDLHDITDLWDKQAPSTLHQQHGSHLNGHSQGFDSHNEMEFQQIPGYDASDLFYSPVLSLNVDIDGTPLISPPDPSELPSEFSMPPSFFSIQNQMAHGTAHGTPHSTVHDQDHHHALSGKSLPMEQADSRHTASLQQRTQASLDPINHQHQPPHQHQHHQQQHHNNHYHGTVAAEHELEQEEGLSRPRSYPHTDSLANAESSAMAESPRLHAKSQHGSKLSPPSSSSISQSTSAQRPSRRSGSTGKIIKQSPLSRPTRWSQRRSSKGEEEELAELEGFPPAFVAGNSSSAKAETAGVDPANTASSTRSGNAVTPAMIMNLGGGAISASAEMDEKFQERLQAAIKATAASSSTSSRKSSVASIRSPKSLGSTPRIAPRTSSTTPNSAQFVHGANTSSTSLDEESAALLESKSNYQQIVDGTHHRLGFTSPEKLSTDVRSKKTSHKIAEQERRNRINTGLMELGKLVSPASPDVSLSSKAAIVEAAIDYIHQLHRRLATLESSTSSVSASQSTAGSPASAPSSTPSSSSSS